MAKPITSSMLPGFNHNIKHNGRIYHVQTEDSGVSNPHIITHLFVGGNILATKKTSYADIVHADNLTVVVQELMEEQHKAMLRNLVNSVYNGMEVPGKPAEPTAPTAQAPQPAEPKPAWGKSSPPTIPPRTQPSIPAHAAPTQPEMPAVGEAQIYKPAPPDKVLKAPKPAKPTPRVSIRPAKPVHPAPAPQPEPRVTVRPTKPVLPAPAPQAVKPAPPVSKPSKDLPPEVVAARRLAERPRPKNTTGPTIFGEDLISDKSLDEVILGYLAGDGEEGS